MVRFRAGRQVGVSREISFRKEYAWNEKGEYGMVVDYTFRSGEGNRLIDEAGTRLGLKKRLPASAKIGIGFFAFGLLGALVTVVTLVVLAVLGKF